LLYLAYTLITNKSGIISESEITKDQEKHSLFSSYLNGVLTNILNPKFLVFIIALFAQMFSTGTTIQTYLFAGISLGAAAALWFSLVSFLINRKHIKEKINSLQ
jgi:threonine/homoserine/homoserine lactone efflux protein